MDYHDSWREYGGHSAQFASEHSHAGDNIVSTTNSLNLIENVTLTAECDVCSQLGSNVIELNLRRYGSSFTFELCSPVWLQPWPTPANEFKEWGGLCAVFVYRNMIIWLERGMMYTYPPPPQTLSPEGSTADDFLDALLGGSDSSSATASPLWSPCTADSGINEDHLTDLTESLNTPSCTAFPDFDTQSFPPPLPLENRPPTNEGSPYVSIDLGKTWFTIKREIKIWNTGILYWQETCET